MKLDRTTLRRLIKEELTREVEEAQLDEVGGHGSAAGRREADARFDAAISYLQELIAGGARGLEGAVEALRGGGDPGDTWHRGLNRDSADARMGEGEVETDEDPLAEAGSFGDLGRQPLSIGAIMFLKGALEDAGLSWEEHGASMDASDGPNGYAAVLQDLGIDQRVIDSVGRFQESEEGEETLDELDIKAKAGESSKVAARKTKPSADSRSTMNPESNARRVSIPEGEEVIDEDDEDVKEEEELDEEHVSINFNKVGQTTAHRSPAGNRPATRATPMGTTSRLPRTQSESVKRPGSLLEVLEERIENLSEVNTPAVDIATTGGFCTDRMSKLCGIEED